MALGRVLIIRHNENDWTDRMIQGTGLADVARAYEPISYWGRRLRTLHYHFPGNKSQWYGPWKQHIDQYDTVILFDVFLGSDMAEFIERQAPRSRLIVYYQNPWNNNYYLAPEARKKCEIWSFDKRDCQRYGLKYNHQFYFYQAAEQKVNAEYKSDIFFVGKDKGRLPILINLAKQFWQAGIQDNFWIVPERKSYSQEERSFLKDQGLPYEEVLKYVKNTKGILDIVQAGQEGLTRRIMEAMFFNKKLITNNTRASQYDFYDRRNIYILGQDHRELETFILEDKSSCWPPEIVARYSFEHWLRNFDDVQG